MQWQCWTTKNQIHKSKKSASIDRWLKIIQHLRAYIFFVYIFSYYVTLHRCIKWFIWVKFWVCVFSITFTKKITRGWQNALLHAINIIGKNIFASWVFATSLQLYAVVFLVDLLAWPMFTRCFLSLCMHQCMYYVCVLRIKIHTINFSAYFLQDVLLVWLFFPRLAFYTTKLPTIHDNVTFFRFFSPRSTWNKFYALCILFLFAFLLLVPFII